MGDWNLSGTDSFVRHYLSQGQRQRVVSRVRHLRRLIDELDVEWVNKYKLLTSDPETGRVYRDVISDAQGGSRLLFSIIGREIRLIGFDLHDDSYDNWNRLTNSQKLAALNKVGELPRELRDAFDGSESRELAKAKLERDNSHLKVYYPEEEGSSWAFHLDPMQEDTVLDVLEVLATDNDMPVCLILGTAGTGKTISILQMAPLVDHAPVNVMLPKPVRDFYTRLNFEIPKEKSVVTKGEVVLLDDPSSVEECRRVLNNAIAREARALVIALDPYQLMRSSGLIELVQFLREKQPYVYYLQSAFRQRKRVGQRTLKLSETLYQVASSSSNESRLSEYHEDWLREKFLTEVAFPHEGGVFRSPQKGSVNELLQKELEGIRSRPFRWNWTEPVLVVWGNEDLKTQHGSMLDGRTFRQVLYKDPEAVRGTEYQEVLLVLGMTDWVELTGSSTIASDVTWKRSSPIHMFLTRARDTVTILIDDERDLQKRMLGLL